MKSIVCPPRHTKSWKHLESLVGDEKALALYIANNEVVPNAKYDVGLRAKTYTWGQYLTILKNVKRYNDRFNSSHKIASPKSSFSSTLYTLELIEDWTSRAVPKNSTEFKFDPTNKADNVPNWGKELEDIQRPLVVTKEGNQYISITGNVYMTYAEALEDKQAEISEDEGFIKHGEKYYSLLSYDKEYKQEIAAKFGIQKIKGLYFYHLSKEQTARIGTYEAGKGKKQGRPVGTTKRGFNLQDNIDGELNYRVENGRGYIYIDVKELVTRDGVTLPETVHYLKLPAILVANEDLDVFKKAVYENATYEALFNLEIKKYLFKTQRATALNAANYALLQLEDLVVNALKNAGTPMTTKQFRALPNEEKQRLISSLGLESLIEKTVQSYKTALEKVKPEELKQEIIEIFKDHFTESEKTEFKDILDALPDEFLKLITFEHITRNNAYFRIRSAKNKAVVPNELLGLQQIYDQRIAYAMNVALRNMLDEGLVTAEEIKELNKKILPAVKERIKTKSLSEKLGKYKAIITTLKNGDKFRTYWDAAIADIEQNISDKNKGLADLIALYSKKVGNFSTVFTEVALGDIDPNSVSFNYDRNTVALHELGHAVDFYLTTTKPEERIKVLAFINDLIGKKEFWDYLKKGLNTRGYSKTNTKEITADLFAWVVGKAAGYDMKHGHLASLDQFFVENWQLANDIYRLHFKLDVEQGIASSIIDWMKIQLNKLIDTINKALNYPVFKPITDSSTGIEVMPQYSNYHVDNLFQDLKEMISDSEMYDITAILTSKTQQDFNKVRLTEEGIKGEEIKPGVQELFKSNPELANAVYEALGLNNLKSKVTLSKKFADTYNIVFNGETIGTIDIPSDLEGDTISIGDVNIKPEFRGKGLGVETYKAAMAIAEKPLESFMATDEANRVWNSLIKQGLAKKTDTGFVTVTSKITPQQKQQAQQLYSQYLDTIFPDSKVKDIVYHGSYQQEKLDNFLNKEKAYHKNAYYFLDKKTDYGNKFINALVNLKNPSQGSTASSNFNVGEGKKQHIQKGFDGVIADQEDKFYINTSLEHLLQPYKKTQGTTQREIIVFEPEQIHILGDKQDIEGFKEFVGEEKTLGIPKVSQQPVEVQQKFAKAKSAFELHPSIPAKNAREIVTTLRGMMVEAIAKQTLKATQENKKNFKPIAMKQGVLVVLPYLHKEYQKLLELPESERTTEQKFAIAQWEILSQPTVLPRLQKFVMLELKQLGYKIDSEGLAESPVEDTSTLSESTQQDETIDSDKGILDVLVEGEDENQVGKGSQGNDYAAASRSTKSTLSTLVKSWLSGIPTTTPSIVGFGQKTYKDLNQVIAVLNSLLRDKATGDEQIAALKKASTQSKEREWLGTIADRLIQEKAVGSPIYNQFVDKFYQKFNQLRLVRTFFEPRGYEATEDGVRRFFPLKDKDGNIIYNLTVKVINLNREDVPKNLRDAWANNFLMQSFSVESEGRFAGMKTIDSALRDEVKNAYENFKTFTALNYKNNTWTSPNKAKERIQQLFSLIGVDLNEPTLYDLVEGFLLEGDKQTFEPYTSKVKGSAFSPKSGFMAQIFEPIIQGTETANNPFGTSGMIRVSEIMSQYIDDYVNTSVSDGKGRKLWAYGIPDPNWVEFTKLISSATQKTSDGKSLTTAEFDKTHIGQVLKDKFSGRSRILNKLKDLQVSPKDLKNFAEALQIFTFNTLKGQGATEGKELKNMVEAEHIFTKISLFTDVKEAIANSKIIQMFITTPSDKSRMECITTLKLDKGFKIDPKTRQITIQEKGTKTLYNYFLAEYDRIKEFQSATPEAKAEFLSNENYLPEIFYFFPQLNDRNYLWKPEGGKFVLRDLNEKLPSGLTVEQHVKTKLNSLAITAIEETRKMWEDSGLIKDGSLITNVPQAYIDSEVDASLVKKDALKSLYDQLKTNPKSAALKEKAVVLEQEVQKNATDYLVADYALNYLIHNMEMHLFLLGDPAMYVKDSKARNNALKETERVFLNEEELKTANLDTIINFVRDVMTNLGKRMAGVQASRQASADSKGHITRILKIADNLLINGKRTNFMSKELADKVYEDLFGADFVSKFKDLKPGDGQGLMSAKEDLYLKYKYGKITKDIYNTMLEKVRMASEDLKAGRPIRNEAMFTDAEKFYTQPIKPVIFANKLDIVTSGDKLIYKRKVIYNKNSEFALYPQWTQDLEIDKLRVLMENTNTDRIAFLSAVKAGADHVIDGVFLQDEDGTILLNDEVLDNFEQFVAEDVDREYFGIQLEVPYDEAKNKIRIATQQIKMIFDEVLNETFDFKGGKVKGKVLQALQAKVYGRMVRNKLGNLFTEMGATPIYRGVPIDEETLKTIDLNKIEFNFENLEKLSKSLIEHAESQGYSTNVLEGLKLSEDKQSFVIPMLFNGNLQKFEKLLLSMVKDVIFQKINGKSFVLGTELGFLPKKRKTRIAEGEEGEKEIEKYKGSIIFVKEKDGKGFGGRGLLGPRLKDKNNPDGEWLPGQVILPWKFKAPLEQFIVDTPEGKFLDTSRISPELLTIIGVRIPTQGHPSMASIEIVGFLPKWAGDLMIAPQDFVAQFGHDFDVDKMYSYIYNYLYGNKEDLSKIKELRKKSRELFIEEVKKSEEIPVKYKEALTYIKTADKFEKDRFTIPEFRNFIAKNVDVRPSKLDEMMEYFDSLSIEEILRINKAAYSEKGRLLHIEDARRKGQDLKDHEKLADFITEKNLGKTFALKKAISEYSNEFIQNELETRFPKYDEYQEYMNEFEKTKELSEERKKLQSEIDALIKNQRLQKIEPNTEDLEDNTQAQLENYLMDIHHAVLSNSTVIKKSLEGIGEGKIKELAATIKGFFQKDGNTNYIPFSDKEKVLEFFDNAAGKIGVGIFSVANTFFALIQEKGVYLQELDAENRPVVRPFRIKNADGTFVDLSRLSGSKGVNRLISIFQSASVDNAKYKALYAISQNEETMGVTAILAALYSPDAEQFDEEYITYYLLQPAIQEYIKALKSAKNSLVEDKLSRADAQRYYLQIMETYEKKLADVYAKQGFNNEQIQEEITKALINPGYSLESTQTDGVEVLGIKNLFENQDALQNDEQFLKAQLALLNDFVYLKNAADELRSIQYAINSDSKGTSPSLFEGHYKQQRFNELFGENKIIYFSDEMYQILNNEGTDSIPYLMSKVAFMANRMFNGNTKQDPILPFLTSKVRKLFDVLMEITGRTGDSTFNQRVVKEMFNSYLSYIWTNPNFNIADTNVQEERFALLVDAENTTSLGTQIEEFKKSELYFKNPKLHPLLAGLKVIPHKEYSDMKFVTFNASSGLVVDDEDIRVALDILHEEAYPLFESLMKYQLLMQGYQSATNMRGLIPIYYFEGFDFLTEMQRMNRNLNGDYGTGDTVNAFEGVATSSIIPKFLEQHLQHHPERAAKMNEEYAKPIGIPQFDSKGRQTGIKKDPSQYVVEFKTLGDNNSNYYKVKDDKTDYVFPYLVRYDNDIQKHRLYRLASKTNKGYLFKELPLLGVNGIDEFDMSSSGQDVVVSMFPENNARINIAKLGYKLLPMDLENQELIKAGVKTLTTRNSKNMEGLWKMSAGLKVQLIMAGQIIYDEKSNSIQIWKNGKQIEAMSPETYARQEGFKSFADLKEYVQNGEGLSLTPGFLTGKQKPYLYKITINTVGRYTPTVQEAIEAELRKKIANESIVEKC